MNDSNKHNQKFSHIIRSPYQEQLKWRRISSKLSSVLEHQDTSGIKDLEINPSLEINLKYDSVTLKNKTIGGISKFVV